MTDAVNPTTGEVLLGPDIDDLVAVLSEISAALAAISDDVIQLRQRQDELERRLDSGAWKQARDEDFAVWVEWLADTYACDEEVRGWQALPALRNELEALWHAAGRGALGQRAGIWDPLSWHDHLARTLARLPEHRGRRRNQSLRHEEDRPQ